MGRLYGDPAHYEGSRAVVYRHRQALRVQHGGGIFGLERFICQHFRALEADFARHYGFDLATLCWGDNARSLRRLSSLIYWLPEDSAMRIEVAPDQEGAPAPISGPATDAEIKDFFLSGGLHVVGGNDGA